MILGRWPKGRVAAVAAAALVASPARSDEPSTRRLVDFRLGVSLGWVAASQSDIYTRTLGLGVLPVEAGVGFRLTDSMALALLGRAGLVHYGGGVELTATQHDWSRDGAMLRVAAVVLRDWVTCFTFEGTSACDAPTSYFFGEVGFQYRWASQSARAISLGISAQIGARRLTGRAGPSTSLAYGLLGPRLQGEF